MLILFQILFALFALFAIFGVLKRKKENQLSTRGAGFWIVFWIFAIIAVMWPNSTTILANRLGIGRGADLVLYISVILIFYLIFKLHLKIEAVSRDITKVVRKDAIDNNKE
jgi:hypothetical protein